MARRARRKKDGFAGDLLDILMAPPWRVGPLLALVAFLFFWLAVLRSLNRAELRRTRMGNRAYGLKPLSKWTLINSAGAVAAAGSV